MRKFMITTATIFVLTSSAAKAEDTAQNTARLYEICAALAVVVERAATDRQNGKPLAPLLEENAKWVHPMIIEIYKGRRYRTAEGRQSIIAELRDGAHVWCLQNLRLRAQD